ncbi:L,D-transpeptidase [Pseudogemmobacter bohemicus]|uniref:L,D-transpeptidase n=1 Tax=Pseudogemmobacter bohemicus TaxID=2250708 RepID=UPI000DD3AFCA|nr:L,D-transpeptidase [Pseudogemmobacter bohemicus]
MSVVIGRRTALLMTLSGLVSACGARVPDSGTQPDPAANVAPEVLAMYGALEDNGFQIPAVNPRYLIPENIRTEVDLSITEAPGAIIVDPWQRYLYLIRGGNRALRYRCAVGDQGRSFSGEAVAQYDRVWPSWRPTDNMIRERPDMYAAYADGLPGGLQNPLGARAIYLFRGGRDTYYRIHGTNEVASIGHATSAGCIRMYNQDAIHLAASYVRGARVLVLTPEQSASAFGAYVPKTTPYTGASFNQDPQSAASPATTATTGQPGYSDPGYAYPDGFPDSPYSSSQN